MNVTQHMRDGGKFRHVPSRDDVGKGARQRNRKTQRGGGADGFVHRCVAPHHKGDGNKAASGADDGGNSADDGADAEKPRPPGQRARGLRFGVKEHFDGGKADEDDENQGDGGGRQKARRFGS